MIPRIIHCCWLGGGPKDSLSRACRASWSRFAPEFEVREWDWSRMERAAVAADVEIPSFVHTARARRKWAFAADWVRFLSLYCEGGAYFDFDFELIRPIDDLMAFHGFIAGQWLPDGSVGPEPAVMALEKGAPLARIMLEQYAHRAFDGKTTVGEILMEAIAAPSEISTVRVLPPEVFSPIGVDGVCHRTAETRGVHHYAMSWASPMRKFLQWLSWHGCRRPVDWVVRVKHTCLLSGVGEEKRRTRS